MDYWQQLVGSENAWPKFLALLRNDKYGHQQIGGHVWLFNHSSQQKLRYAELRLRQGLLMVIKQNPKKTLSDGGRLVKEGHEVFQVRFGQKYIGMIVDGVYQAY